MRGSSRSSTWSSPPCRAWKMRSSASACPPVSPRAEPTSVYGGPSRRRVSLPRFEGRIFSAEDVTRGKPAPDLFLHAARRMGVAPSRCAIVEDSPLGVDAANAAGMVAFGFARMTPAAASSHAGGGIFSSMAELPALLEG